MFVFYNWPFPHVYFAKNVAYLPFFNSWLSFQRQCRLLWGYHFHFVDSSHASNNSLIPVTSWHMCLFWSPRRRQPPWWPTPTAFGVPIRVALVKFRGDLWRQKTRFSGLSCGVLCVILRLAILVEHRLVTDTDTGQWLVLHMHSIAR